MWWICNPLYPNRLTPNPSSRNAAASKILMIKFFISQSLFTVSEMRKSISQSRVFLTSLM